MNAIMEMGQLNRKGMMHCQQGDLNNAEFLLRQALMRSRACASPLPGAKVLHNLAIVMTLKGRKDEAKKLLQQALRTTREAKLESTRFHSRIEGTLQGLAA